MFIIFIYPEKKQLHGWNLLSSPLINNSKDLQENVGLIFHPMKTNQDCTYLIPKILSSLIKEKHCLTLGVRILVFIHIHLNQGWYVKTSKFQSMCNYFVDERKPYFYISYWYLKSVLCNKIRRCTIDIKVYFSKYNYYYCCRAYPFFHHQTAQQMMTKMYYISFTWPQACIIHLKPKIRLHSLVE